MSLNAAITLFNTVLLPDVEYRLAIDGLTETETKRFEEDENHIVFLVMQNEKPRRLAEEHEILPIGVEAEIMEVGEGPMGKFIVARTKNKVKVLNLVMGEELVLAETEPLPEVMDITYAGEQKLLKEMKKITAELAAQIRGGEYAHEFIKQVKSINEYAASFGQFFDMTPEEKYALLETDSFAERSRRIYEALLRFKGTVELQVDLSNADDPEGRAYKKAAIMKQMKMLERELQEMEPEPDEDEDSFEKRIERAGMPEKVRKEVERVLKRFRQEPSNSPEYNSIYNYLDFVTSLQWTPSERKPIDLAKARRIMDRDHYGLEKVKERILQYLAVMALSEERDAEGGKDRKKDRKQTSPKQKGTILLLVGAPGTGKTSMGRSVAEALGREYVRISLGGIRDEAEIRGHRRTYIGAMPGRIMAGLKRAGTMDPVIVLDEVDKLMSSYNGDPSAALLEALDPEQNGSFEDHYVDLPYDLSRVFFICTANTWDTIPRPLLDRMEVIELPGYTPTEHFEIAKKHLIPQAMQETGLTKDDLKITGKAIRRIISEYTMEAGVRGLKKQLLTVCRKAAVRVVEVKTGRQIDSKDNPEAVRFPIRVTDTNLEDFLGRKKIRHDKVMKDNPPGVVTGLAWTQAGGEILFIETAAMKGSGHIHLTGQIGEVMKESAETAASLVKSAFIKSELVFGARDIHIHIPEGAVPKDGPSAGITMVTALTSLVTGIRVSPYLAMTGEISLRGQVLPIGGLPEKLMAAERAGIRKVLIPSENAQDLEDVPEEIREKLEIIPVSEISEVIHQALGISFPERVFLPFELTEEELRAKEKHA